MRNTRIKLYRIFRNMDFDRQQIDPQASLKEDLAFGQFEWTCFLYYLEARFNVKIGDDEVDNLRTVEDTVRLIEEKLMIGERMVA